MPILKRIMMPTYIYQILNDDDTPTGETVEIFHSMKDPDVQVYNGKKVRKDIAANCSTIMLNTSGPSTLGMIAAKNTEKMVKEGQIKPTPKPWWRSERKPLNIKKWSAKEKAEYIKTGKKPT